MDCRYCNRELVDYDGKTWAHVGKVLLSLTKLPGFANGVYNVVRTIYYDCSDIRQTDVYLYCEKCKVYFIPCCYCGYPNCIGSEILVSPKKIKCDECLREYVYATHLDSDVDHGI